MTDTAQPAPFVARLLGAMTTPRVNGVTQAAIESWRLNVKRDLISREEMSRRMNVHRSVVRRMVRDGEIPLTPTVINAEPYYDRAAFLAWLSEWSLGRAA